MRHLKGRFLKEFFKGGQFYEIIKMVKTDPSLDVELRGNSVMIYYRGGKLLTINDPYKNDQEDLLKELDKQYVSPTRKGLINPIAVPKPTIDNMEAYICKGKRAIDWYEENVARKLGEKEIQQRVAYENNFSVNAEDTDFFIADIEWEDRNYGGRADIIAFKWFRSGNRRKNMVKMFMIEVKQGEHSLTGSAGLAKHMTDFEAFVSDKSVVSKVKKDMIQVLYQKYQLGLVKGLNHLFEKEELPIVEEECDFVYLLANYHLYSTKLNSVLEEEMKSITTCKFITSCLMGYGLYNDMIISKEDVLKKYPLARK